MVDPYGPTGLIRAVELYRPATVSIVRRLKSNLGEMLMLMLSAFHHVRVVSTLVLGPRHRFELQLTAGHGSSIFFVDIT